MDALVPKTRCDKGETRVITEEVKTEIRRLRREYPRLNATQIHDHLVEDALLPATVSVSSVQRYIKRNNLRGSAAAQVKDQKTFEEAYFGVMWQSDPCYLPYLKEGGCSKRFYLVMVLDDYSRMIVGRRLFYQDTAVLSGPSFCIPR